MFLFYKFSFVFASSYSLKSLNLFLSNAPRCSSSSTARLLDPSGSERRGRLRWPLLRVLHPRKLGRRAGRRRGDAGPVKQRGHGLRRLRSLRQPVADAVELESDVLGAVLGWGVRFGLGWGGVFLQRKRGRKSEEELEKNNNKRIVGGPPVDDLQKSVFSSSFPLLLSLPGTGS